MANWTNEELREWAENISVTGYGRVTQARVKKFLIMRANAEELAQGFNRSEICTITSYVNEIQTSH